MSNLKKPVCLITGLGEGTGGHTARRFAKAGYRIAMLARTEERLRKFEKELPGSKGYICDVSDLKHLEDVCKKIKNEMSSKCFKSDTSHTYPLEPGNSFSNFLNLFSVLANIAILYPALANLLAVNPPVPSPKPVIMQTGIFEIDI